MDARVNFSPQAKLSHGVHKLWTCVILCMGHLEDMSDAVPFAGAALSGHALLRLVYAAGLE